MMKINRLLTVIVLTGIIFGQYNPDNHVVTTSMYYMNYVEDGSWDEFFELAEEEFTKMNRADKNLVSLLVLGHRHSGARNEVVQIAEWKSIADADKSTVGTADMRKKAWPNEEKRKAFNKKYGRYWNSKHTDLHVRELVTSRVKRNNKSTTENTVVTVVEWYLKPMSEVEGGTVAEREALFDEFHKKVIMRNDKILSRREMKHYWTGSLGGGTTPVVFVTEYPNMAIADDVTRNRETIQKSWPDEDDRKAFFEKRNKYIDFGHNLGHRDIALHTNWVKLAKR